MKVVDLVRYANIVFKFYASFSIICDIYLNCHINVMLNNNVL